MNIITENVRNGRIQDGIATILKLDDETFEKIVERMRPVTTMEDFNFYYITDSCRRPDRISQIGLEELNIGGQEVVRGYFAEGSKVPVEELFPMFEKLLSGFSEGTKVHTRLQKLLETRNLEALKEYYINKNPNENIDAINKVFEILSNQELFEKFLDFDNNQELFEIEGTDSPKYEICRTIERAFGELQYEGRAGMMRIIKDDFYIPELPEIQERVKKAYEAINFNRYTNGVYEFRSPLSGRVLSRRGTEEEFTIDPDLRRMAYENMPEDLSLEEKAVYIYAKLCKTLVYDTGTIYERRQKRIESIPNYSKEFMENIKIGSKVDCFAFSRIFAKFVNEFEGDIGAVVLSTGEGSSLHSFVGVYTDRVSGTFDGTGTPRGIQEDDLTKAKLGIMFSGIGKKYDDDGILYNAVKKVYPMALGRQPVTHAYYMEQLKCEKTYSKFDDNLGQVLRMAVELGRNRGLSGNELTQFLDAVSNMESFGPRLEKFYIGRNTEKSREDYDRIILFRRSYFGLENDNPFFVVETKSGELLELSKEEVEERYRGCKWESEFHKCVDIDLNKAPEELVPQKKEAPMSPEDHDDR